jgi:hypothetical protein
MLAVLRPRQLPLKVERGPVAEAPIAHPVFLAVPSSPLELEPYEIYLTPLERN